MTSLEPLRLSPIGTELLDDPSADPATVAASLDDIARANRWFGGTAAVRRGLRRALSDLPPGATVTLADFGTGLGDLPRAAARWAARRGVRLVAIGEGGSIDLQPCGGTHVRRTGEIGRVTVAKPESKGKQNRRIRLNLV